MRILTFNDVIVAFVFRNGHIDFIILGVFASMTEALFSIRSFRQSLWCIRRYAVKTTKRTDCNINVIFSSEKAEKPAQVYVKIKSVCRNIEQVFMAMCFIV